MFSLHLPSVGIWISLLITRSVPSPSPIRRYLESYWPQLCKNRRVVFWEFLLHPTNFFFNQQFLSLYLQVKSVIRGESPPFSAGQLEGIAATINMNTRVARKLSNSSLRYWIIEFLRRQPKERRYRALVLRFIKDRNAALLLIEVNLSCPICCC